MAQGQATAAKEAYVNPASDIFMRTFVFRTLKDLLSRSCYILSPIRILLYGCGSVIIIVLIGTGLVRRETILTYASEAKPYSAIFNAYPDWDVDTHSNLIRIICFGDSNSFYPPHKYPFPDDADKYIGGLIEERLRDQVGPYELLLSEWAFLGSNMFDFYCFFFRALECSPDLIIVPINWRSFGYHWIDAPGHFHPELSAFVPLREVLASGPENPIRVRGISPIKHLEYKIYFLSLYPIGLKIWASENLRFLRDSLTTGPGRYEGKGEVDSRRNVSLNRGRSFPSKLNAEEMKNYLPMEVTDSNPVLRSLAALSEAASRKGTRALFYIWPLDYEYYMETGIFDISRFELSKAHICHLLNKQSIYLLDLSYLLEHEYFVDMHGHCEIKGRQRIAEALADEIIAISKMANLTADSRDSAERMPSPPN